jgi:hypothetical protein
MKKQIILFFFILNNFGLKTVLALDIPTDNRKPITSPIFVQEIDAVFEALSDELQMFCFDDRLMEINIVEVEYELIRLEMENCVIELKTSEFSDFESLESAHPRKWICTVSGAGKKSKCYYVKN